MKDNRENEKQKVIIYALGYYWKELSEKITNQYDVIACSDKNKNAMEYAKGYPFINPEQICNMCYDKIVVGGKARGIREILFWQYGLPVEKIFYYDELFGEQIIKRKSKKEKHAQRLTIVIPTYNRKQRLQRTLDLLELQSDDDFDIILLDNCSEYNIDEVFDTRKEAFKNRITVVHNKANIGMAANLANAFIQKNEGWVWMLSDDDIPSMYAVEDIYEEIGQSSDLGIIHFSIYDLSNYMGGNVKIFKSLHELMDFYGGFIFGESSTNDFNGDFIFFSNKVYNMKYIKKYYDKIFYYAYSGAPQVVPILFMLDDGVADMKISNRKIVGYDAPEGDHWDWIKTLSGMRTITDFPIKLSKENRKTLCRLVMGNYLDNLLDAIDGKQMDYDIRQIEKIYDEVYCYSFNEKEKEEYQIKMKILKEREI